MKQNFCGTCGAKIGQCQHTVSEEKDEEFDPLTGLLISGAVGYLTGSAILGGLVGGNYIGGVVGDVANDDSGFGLDDLL